LLYPGNPVPLLADRHDTTLQEKSILGRLLRQTPAPDDGIFGELTDFVAIWVQKHIPALVVPEFDDWLDHTHYSQGRKEQLRKVKESLNGAFPSKRTSSKINSFIKFENYPEMKLLRFINSRVDDVKVIFGPAMHAIEEYLFSMPYFAKCFKTPGSLVDHIHNAPKGRWWLETDFTAFESHMTARVMRALELVLYKKALANYPILYEYIARTLTGVNHLRSKDGVSAKVRAGRMSGDMNTSLGNSFTNLMLLLFIAYKAGDPDPWVIVEGDDGLMGAHYPIDPSLFAACGFSCKAKHVDDPSHASFCGKTFSQEKQVIRDPLKFMAKFNWSDKAVGTSDKHKMRLLKAKALSAIYETPHCPITRAVADYALAVAGTVRPLWDQNRYEQVRPDKHFHVPSQETTPSTRALYAQMYGITPEQQALAEASIRRGNLGVLRTLLKPHSDLDWWAKVAVVTVG
jgi:hypothetical protein